MTPERAAYLRSKGAPLAGSRSFEQRGAAPLVSVITPHLPSRADQLQACIISVKTQWYPPIQHIVVDDDGSLPDPHWGAAARNKGQAYAKGDYIAYLDDDDTFRPWHVSLLASMLTAAPEAMWAYAAVAWHRSDGIRYTYADPPELGNNPGSIFMHRREFPAEWKDGPTEDWDVLWPWIRDEVPYVSVNVVTADARALFPPPRAHA